VVRSNCIEQFDGKRINQAMLALELVELGLTEQGAIAGALMVV
jgi:hypothetical protein